MSTKVGIIAEGPIDHALLPPLLERIAQDRAQFDWPLAPEDMAGEFMIRKRGHGGVLETVRTLVKALESGPYDHSCFVIVLDRRTAPVQKKVRRLIQDKPRFVLGIAIEEIEAWWLGDRANTLAWTGLGQEDIPGDCVYGAESYAAEKDKRPKATLDELTQFSPELTTTYGEGNLDLAIDFAESHWQRQASLDQIAAQCPKGFGRFQSQMANAFRRAKAAQGRLI